MSTQAQRSFSAGEITPALYARCDVAKYLTALRQQRNAITMQQGGLQNRPGTAFVCETKFSAGAGNPIVRLIKFRFNDSQTYALEFGDLYVRFIQAGSLLYDVSVAITGITPGATTLVTSAAHGLSNGQEVAISGVVGMTQLNGNNYIVAGVTTNTFLLNLRGGASLNSTGFSAYTSGGTASRVYEIVSPYAAGDLAILDFAQLGDVITFAHPSYAPRQLSRTAQTNWSFSTPTFAPQISAPTGVAVSGTTGTAVFWVVTAVDPNTGEESIASAAVGANSDGTTASARVISWSAVTSPSGATVQLYNIYKSYYGTYGFVGVARAGALSFTDPVSGTGTSSAGVPPNYTTSPPTANNPFSGANNYPGAVSYIQQRLTFGFSNNNPARVWCSRTGSFKNFSVSIPSQASDSLQFDLVGDDVQSIRHFTQLGSPIVATSEGEWALWGDGSISSALSPSTIGAKQYGYNGTSYLPPILINTDALFVQARGSHVRDLNYRWQQNGYVGDDLSRWSAHLVDGFTLVDWSFQKLPNSIVWMVRSDGALLGLTYVKDEEVFAWHRHDTGNGDLVKNVCCIPEGTEDATYLVIQRSVDTTRTFIERMDSRLITGEADLLNRLFVDSALTFDGRATSQFPGGAPTMTLTGGSQWLYTELLTLTCSQSFFTAGMVGSQIQLGVATDLTQRPTGVNPGDMIRFTITGYTSSTVVTGYANKTVSTDLQNTASTNWAWAVSQLGGLGHLAGKKVSVQGDGFVVASPNNALYPVVTVTAGGTITLDKPYAVIHAGLPYITDVETLDIDEDRSETLADKLIAIGEVIVKVWNSRGLFFGSEPPKASQSDPLLNLYELKQRHTTDGYDSPVPLETDIERVGVQTEWSRGGRIFLRQVDPLPFTLLSVYPKGFVPKGR